MEKDDSNEAAQADVGHPGSTPSPSERTGNATGTGGTERVIAPDTLEAARAVVRHYAERRARQAPQGGDDA